MSATAAAMYDRGNGNGTKDIWKNIAMFLGGAVVSMGIVWATYVRDAVSRKEVEAIIETQGPYIRDKSGIEVRLTNIESGVKGTNEQLNRISDAVGARRK